MKNTDDLSQVSPASGRSSTDANAATSPMKTESVQPERSGTITAFLLHQSSMPISTKEAKLLIGGMIWMPLSDYLENSIELQDRQTKQSA